MLERCVGRRGCSPRRSCWRCVVSFALLPVGRPGLLPGGRRRPVQAAPARADRHAHRGDGGALRPGRGRDPRRSSRRASSTSIIDNIGLPYSGINLSYSNSAPIGAGGRRHPGRADARTTGRPRTYIHDLRIELARRVSRRPVLLPPADIVSQILNFGLPAPIDVQVVGPQHRGEPAVRGDAARPKLRAGARASSTCASTRRSTSRRCSSTSTARAPRRSGSPSATSPTTC